MASRGAGVTENVAHDAGMGHPGAAPGAYLDGARPYPPDLIGEYTRQGWWPNHTFVDLFRRAVRRRPDREALVDDHRRLTWRDVEREVAVLTCALRERGVRRYDRVLLQLPSRAEYVMAFYACQHLGAVPVAAVPRVGAVELQGLIELAEPAAWFFPLRDGSRDFSAVVQTLRARGRLPRLPVAVGDEGPPPSTTVPYRELLAGHEPEACLETAASLPRPDPNDVAVIFLTGGATGRSKLVPRTHNSFLGNVRVIAANGTPDDVLINSTPVAHGMANQGPLGSWITHGSRLVMVGSPRMRRILEVVSRERVTSLFLVPAQLADLLDDPDREAYDLTSLQFAGTTSAHLSQELALRACELFGAFGCRFGGSAYGCTEGPSVGHDPDEPLDRMLHTVGRRTSPGHHWVVLGLDGRELPAGEVGELAARGPSVFTGYYRAPEDNRAIFTGSGYYKTGDLGFIDAEGYIHLTGRLKDIIQRGGEAVVPTEIEELLVQHPSVSRAAVVAMPDTRLGERACAYVVPRPGADLTLDGLVDFLRSRGAGPLQWPERLELIPAMPETAAGKLDRVTLRADIATKVGGREERSG